MRILAWLSLSCLVLSLVPALPENAAGETYAPFLKIPGESVEDLFGYRVASADLNADGRNDLIVSAPFHGPTGVNTGRVYVYFGDPVIGDVPDVILDPPLADTVFGSSITAGDLNGDGLADLVVGTGNDPYHDGGHLYIYLGGPNFDSVPDITMKGSSIFDKFGFSVSMAGDFNSDGSNDLIVGSPAYPDGAAAYLFWGGPAFDTTPDLILGSEARSTFGAAVSSAGDFNGDGIADVAVGAPSHVYIYFGGQPPDTSADVILSHEGPEDNFGQSFASIGDINGDGATDFIASAYRYGPYTGQTYVYFGGHNPDAVTDLTMTGKGLFDAFGYSVSPAGDVNGDGFSDFAVGSLGFGPGAGRALVFLGGAAPDTIPDLVLSGDPDGWAFSSALSTGDITGDGLPDLLVGESGTDEIVGQAYAFDIASSLPARAFVRGARRTFPITGTSPPLCLRVEPVDGSYTNSEVDPSSFRLLSKGTGEEEDAIDSVPGKESTVSDVDSNGVEDLGVCFGQSDLARLFSEIAGRTTLQVKVEGRLVDGRRFSAPFGLTIQKSGHRSPSIRSTYPNPFNPTGTLVFETHSIGPVSIHLYDVAGRRVRTLASSIQMTKGVQRVSLDGLDDRGMPLGSGVYFYRVEEVSGVLSGKIVIAR